MSADTKSNIATVEPVAKVKWLDILFSGCQWYRKLKGGTWCQVTPSSFPEISVWVQDPKERFERINKVAYFIKPIEPSAIK